jgi:integrase/recombinase XerD
MYVPIDIEKAVRRECKRRGYSDKTADTFWFCINRFLKLSGKTIDKVSKKDVRLFLEGLSEKGRAGSTLNVYHMAIRFLFHDVLDKRMWIDIHYSKVPEKMPVVLAKEEVRKLLGAIDNRKHKLMMQLIYAAGLRVSELINLKAKDVEFGKNYGFVRKGKGNKDRIFIIPLKLENKLKELVDCEGLKKEDFLFTSIRGHKYTISCMRMIVQKATEMAGIEKKVHPHTLRHSFATHLVEEGYSLQDVQAVLGHKSPETSLIYVHMASPKMISIRSPFDSLNN